MRPYTDFGLKARAIMLQKGIAIQDVAKAVGISRCYVSDLFTGARETLKQKQKISDFLGME